MSIIAKLCNKLLHDRIVAGLDHSLRINHNGFRSLRLTAQQILAARRLIEEIIDSRGKFIAIFVNFSKAFHSIKWDWIRAILLHYNVPSLLVEAVMSLYH